MDRAQQIEKGRLELGKQSLGRGLTHSRAAVDRSSRCARGIHACGVHSLSRVVRHRRGSATLDYVLVMGVVLPLAVFLFLICPVLMNLVYEFTVVVTSWPFQ